MSLPELGALLGPDGGGTGQGPAAPAPPPESSDPPATPEPPAPPGPAVAALSAGGRHTCALLVTGDVDCWGANDQGQLGDGTTTGNAAPVRVAHLANVTSIAAGSEHTCAVHDDGAVACWGDDAFGQVDGVTRYGTPQRTVYAPVDVPGVTDAIAVSTGDSNSCALLAGGTLTCWGHNGGGELGGGAIAGDLPPTANPDVTGATEVSVGSMHACALLLGGAVDCWGHNPFGQLGTGADADSAHPAAAGDLSTAVSITVGQYVSCALLVDGAIDCWGHAGGPQSWAITDSTSPRAMMADAVAVDAGGYHVCAVLRDASVRCWGNTGAFDTSPGDGSATRSVYAVQIPGIDAATAVSAGHDHDCAIISDTAVSCWGSNGAGQLGNGTVAASSRPTAVLRLP
jgi:alpha-tubulin suppressor-like RCC1 family protein